ncbi:MAG TPA: SUMF1/EgtB/PvdO family nonheme iron enzyme [Candidatus Eisenbacteria bacterium]|nr:SUMF1/EgtB/PvdO family nonheme iron enzyme [Candidatus Eisenbacteria bacterium]
MRLPRPSRFWSVTGIALLVFVCAITLHSDEWKARHALIAPNGTMTLTIPPSPSEVFFPGPADPPDPNWLAGLKAWRRERRTQLRMDESDYSNPELAWTRRTFSQVQLLVWDRTIYDPETRQYTPENFLAETESRLGPIDAVLLWHVYPNIGVDDRNQFDLLRDLPGGLPALKKLVADFHRHNVKVLFPVLAWDSGTHQESTPPWTALTQLLSEIGADGINFDTLESVPADYQAASIAARHPLAFEPQFEIRDESLAWSTLGWNDWVTWEDVPYPSTPMVSKMRWLEPRHMVDVTDRFTRDKTDSLQHAFFNGEGYATLENLWGFWYPMSPHDAEAVLRFTRIERAFADNLVSPDWEPHTPTLQAGVFASKFPLPKRTLWTIVNRNEFDVEGQQLRVPYQSGIHYFDLWHGLELQPRVNGSEATLSFSLEGLGYGAILATGEPASTELLRDFLPFMAERSRKPLRDYSRSWSFVPQTIVEIPATKPAASAPNGMIKIPEGDFDFSVRGIEIEGGNDPGVDVQYPWEASPRRSHLHRMHLRSYYMDRTPVTNVQFKRFLGATHYHPADDHNFLRDWSSGTFPAGWDNKPVTWVSLEDARAYAAWAGKRLPHEWEWQYAAQSSDGRLYPWGNEWNAADVPAPDRGHTQGALSDVDEHPQSASPFGVLDMVGSVSQWTDEFRDPHTRAAIVRGAAAYQPLGSVWYFPQTYRLDEHEKLLLMAPSRDRAGTIGFRCVVDAQ